MSGTLSLVGMGRRPAADPTLDALDALARCEVALCAGLSPEALARVRGVAPSVRVFGGPSDPRAHAALQEELAAGRRVAWVGMGHPAESAPPPAARGSAAVRVAKGVNPLDARLIAGREVLSYGAAYFPPDGLEPSEPRKGDTLVGTADWPATAAARARSSRALTAEGRKRLSAGDADGAARVLHDAPILDPEAPEPWEWLGRALLAQGKPHEAWRMFWEARLMGAPVKRVSALIDSALVALGRTGETAAARRKKRKAGLGRPHAERAERLAREGDLEGARTAWDAAVAAEPTAAMYDARAEWVKRTGLPLEDLADRREAAALAPTPARRAAYADALRHARFHALARKELDRAAKEKGAEARVFRLRGLSRLRSGDWRGALRDAAEAARRGEPAHRLLLLRAEAAAASGAPAKTLAPLIAAAGPDDAAWLRGYAALAEGRPDPALLERAAAALDADSARARLARVLAALGRAWGWCPPAPKTPGLVLIGLGVAPPRSLTAEGVAALRGCDVVFQNTSSDMVGPMLRLMCRDLRPSPFHHEYDVARLVEAMLTEAKRGRVVGFATFGHPLLFGPLARAALARFDRMKVPVRIVAGPSTLGEMLSAGARLGPVTRWQTLVGLSLGSAAAAERLDPSLPTLLYPEEGPAEKGGVPLLEAVASRYPAGHRAIVLGPDAEDWDRPLEMTLEQIARMPGASAKQRLVFVPAAR